MNKVRAIDASRAVQTLRKWNVESKWSMTEGWTLSGGIVDECVYSRLAVDKNNQFCLYTASLCWDIEDLDEMIEATKKVKDCLYELANINEDLVK